jgi:UrcA family protein
MNYSRALAMCGATLVAAVAIGTVAYPVEARGAPTVEVVAHPEDLVVRRVSYADLNLGSAPGERTLNRRVAGAVMDVCSEAVGGNSTDLVYRDCAIGAWRAARPQISLAVERARQIAATGTSSIAAVAITVSPSK